MNTLSCLSLILLCLVQPLLTEGSRGRSLASAKPGGKPGSSKTDSSKPGKSPSGPAFAVNPTVPVTLPFGNLLFPPPTVPTPAVPDQTVPTTPAVQYVHVPVAVPAVPTPTVTTPTVSTPTLTTPTVSTPTVTTPIVSTPTVTTPTVPTTTVPSPTAPAPIVTTWTTPAFGDETLAPPPANGTLTSSTPTDSSTPAATVGLNDLEMQSEDAESTPAKSGTFRKIPTEMLSSYPFLQSGNVEPDSGKSEAEPFSTESGTGGNPPLLRVVMLPPPIESGDVEH